MNTGFTFADVYDEVVARAGGEQSTAEDVIKVRRGLRLLLERWEAQRYNTWRIRSMPIHVTGHQPYVQLPECVDDVVIVNGPGGGALTRIGADEYMAISRKDMTGRPGSWWLQRVEPPRLHFHPTGDGQQYEVWFVERPADFDAAQANMSDVPGRWLEAMILGLAKDLASKRPPYDEALIARLTREAELAEATAHDADRDRARFRYRLGR